MTTIDLVRDLTFQYWAVLHPEEPLPRNVVVLKVMGKTSPKASIVCLVLDGKRLHDLVEGPIDQFFQLFDDVASDHLSASNHDYLRRLPSTVAGLRLRLCAQHGDFNAYNVLVDDRRNCPRQFSIIDWEDFRTHQLPIHDLNHFFTSNSHALGGRTSPEDSYSRFVLSEGWYRELYLRTLE